jgi:putative oxidoreductase
MEKLDSFLNSYRDWAPLSLRLIAGWMLLAGSSSIALFINPITGVVDFFQQLNMPVPTVSAYVAIYAQFICGILLILGLWIRQAALVLVFYFSVALLAAHTQDPITQSFPAWALWAMSICLALTGAGKLAIENQWK